ncbi:DUF6304 family protein [uncultured Aquimarina sp.]|uniref:DUF6304 family protein n=1 Tax=uncultured Aquimarina sp. TaxID=575652 RepID=UPI002623BAFB|nr:DUF6304 family protein [uncultured Aquimarina sp.]
MRKYSATYQDRRGTETTVIKSDGSDMFLTLRDIDFEGHDFEMFTGEVDNTKFDYAMSADGSGDLTNFKITITIPTLFYNSLSNQTFTENLTVHIEVGETKTLIGLDSEINSLRLVTSFGEFKVEKKLEWMEDALIALQNQLPENIYLKTCLSCKYGNYSPFGNGMFGNVYCFKNIKEQLVAVNDKTDLLDIWTKEAMESGDIFSVQETFDCDEHQLLSEDDWVYKSWTKFITVDEVKEQVINSHFYKELNTLLRSELSKMKQSINSQYEKVLKEREFQYLLPIICRFEYASWGGNRQWRLELDFDDYQWSNKTVKPHFLNAFVSFDISKDFIHFKYQLCSSFDEILLPMEVEQIEIKMLTSVEFVSNKIQEVELFLKNLPLRFIQQIKKIDFDDLEFVLDDED